MTNSIIHEKIKLRDDSFFSNPEEMRNSRLAQSIQDKYEDRILLLERQGIFREKVAKEFEQLIEIINDIERRTFYSFNQMGTITFEEITKGKQTGICSINPNFYKN